MPLKSTLETGKIFCWDSQKWQRFNYKGTCSNYNPKRQRNQGLSRKRGIILPKRLAKSRPTYFFFSRFKVLACWFDHDGGIDRHITIQQTLVKNNNQIPSLWICCVLYFGILGTTQSVIKMYSKFFIAIKSKRQ